MYFSAIEIVIADGLDLLIVGVKISKVVDWFEFIKLVFTGLLIWSEFSL